MKLRFGFSLNLSVLALLCIFALSYVTASDYSIVRTFKRTGSSEFSMIYRTSNDEDYNDIVDMHYSASFLMDSDKLADSILSKSVKRILSKQSLVVYLVESFFRGGTPRFRVLELLENFARITGMTLKFVMADESNRPNLQPYIDAFEEAGVVFLNDYSVMTSANIDAFVEDDVDFHKYYPFQTSDKISAYFEKIYLVDFGELGKKGRKKLRKKLRRLERHIIEPMVLDDYVRRFSRTEHVAKPRSENLLAAGSADRPSLSILNTSDVDSKPSASAVSTALPSTQTNSTFDQFSTANLPLMALEIKRPITACCTAGTFTLLFKGALSRLNNLKLHDQHSALVLTAEELLATDNAVLRELRTARRQLVIQIDQPSVLHDESAALDFKRQINTKLNRISSELKYVLMPYSISINVRNVFLDGGVNEIHLTSQFGDEQADFDGIGNPFEFRNFVLVDLDASVAPANLLRVLETKLERQEVAPVRFEQCSAQISYFAAEIPPSSEVQKFEQLRDFLRDGRPFYLPRNDLRVSRITIFDDSFNQIKMISDNDLRHGRLVLSFNGESGIDSGVLTREWYTLLVRQVFNPDYALFVSPQTDQNAFHFHPLSNVNDNFRALFRFVGRFIGKAIVDGIPITCNFSRAVYKIILGKELTLYDLEQLEPVLHRFLVWIADDATDENLQDMTFTVNEDKFGAHQTIELKPNGANITLTNENKFEYIQLVIRNKLFESLRPQIDAFLDGFHRIVPAAALHGFTVRELQKLISGEPDINVDDWYAHTRYVGGLTANSPRCDYFWQAVLSFTIEQRINLLRFATGSAIVPAGGFRNLSNNGRRELFTIDIFFGDHNQLPRGNTCLNRIDLPNFISVENAREKLLYAITEGNGTFAIS